MAEQATLTVQSLTINFEKRELILPQRSKGYQFSIGDYNFKIISNFLDAEMTQYAVDMTILAHIYFSRPVDRAHYITQKFNEKFGVYWQCVIGVFDHFGDVQDHRYISFYMNSLRITLFKGAQQ